MGPRRDFIKQSSLVGLAGAISPLETYASVRQVNPKQNDRTKWLDGSRLVVSVSMQFEAGGQPDNAESPFPQNMGKGYKDLPADTWYQYGYKEGIPRMLDNWDKLGIKVTSHMVGSAVLANPELAKETVGRGQEASAHGTGWSAQYHLCHTMRKGNLSRTERMP